MSQDVLITPETTQRRLDVMLMLRAAVIDVLLVLVFAFAGRLSHDEGLSAAGVLGTAWPFLVGVAGGWLGILLTRWRPLSNGAAAMMLFKTVVLGIPLRAVVQDAGTPVAFVVTTTVVLAVLFFGWRAVARLVAARRHGAAPAVRARENGASRPV
jgi:hypothetical protein